MTVKTNTLEKETAPSHARFRRYNFAASAQVRGPSPVLLGWLVLQSFAITTGSTSNSIGHDVMTMVLGVAIFLVVFERSALRRIMAVVLALNILTACAYLKAHKRPVIS
jgi:hypothetical protein